jgi:zinc transporter, ZIP family
LVEAFIVGALAAATLVVGGLIVFIRKPAERTLGLVMAFGAGVLVSAVAFELVEEATETLGSAGAAFVGLFAGAITFTLGDAALARYGVRHRKDIGGAPLEASGLAIVLGAVLDGVPESAVLGLTLLQTGNVSLSMFVAVLVSNLPEAIAASSSLVSSGWSRRGITVLWTAVAVVAGLSSAAGFILLDGATPQTLSFVLTFAGGAILTMLATTMMPEAFDHAGRPAGLATVLGFAVAYGIDLIGR